MNGELGLLTGMAASIVTSAAIWLWVREALRAMLAQAFERPGSSEFWLRYALLMLVIAPLVLVVFFTPDDVHSTVQVMRRLLLAILLGHFIAFALVGRGLLEAVGRALERETAAARAARADPPCGS